MAEILTESFCERCGTRYTFQAAVPTKKRLGRFKTLSKGLKNYVLSDETSLEEAFADARSDLEREVSSQQLEAFHQTFNFCMTCRQYTCANCWNEVEGRCLTCAPDLTHDILPQAFPDLEPLAGIGAPSNGQLHDAPENGFDRPEDALAWPDIDIGRLDRGTEPEARVQGPVEAERGPVLFAEIAAQRKIGAEPPVEASPETATPQTATPETDAPVEAEAEVPVVAEAERDTQAQPEAEAAVTVESVIEAEALADVEPPVAEAPVAAAAPPAQPETAPAEPELAADQPAQPATVAESPAGREASVPRQARPLRLGRPTPLNLDEKAAVAAAQTAELLARFRPGQSLDEAIAEYEAQAGLAEPHVHEGIPAPAARPTEVAPPPVPGPQAQVAEPPAPTPQPETVEPEPFAAEPPAAAPEPPAAATPEPAPEAVPATRREDRVEAPVWRVVAPDSTQPDATQPAPPPPAAPQWPSAPQWPTPQTTSPQWPSASNTSAPSLAAIAGQRSVTDLWAASSQEVLSAQPSHAAGAANTGVQACVSCGLPLSATARFCRRCGSRQG